MWAISGTSGSSGLGSVSSEQMDSSTCGGRRAQCRAAPRSTGPTFQRTRNSASGRPLLASARSTALAARYAALGRAADAAGRLPARPARVAARALLIVSAGDHCSFKMSRQMLPCPLMLGWYTWKNRPDARQGAGARVGGHTQWAPASESLEAPGCARRGGLPPRGARGLRLSTLRRLTLVWKFTLGGLKG